MLDLKRNFKGKCSWPTEVAGIRVLTWEHIGGRRIHGHWLINLEWSHFANVSSLRDIRRVKERVGSKGIWSSTLSVNDERFWMWKDYIQV